MSGEDTLCCCEYHNMKGEKSHLLASCCDCEAFDEMADRCFKCEKIPSSVVDRFLETCYDRLRIPGLTGGGAARVGIDVIAPVVIIPVSLIIAAVGPMTTLVVLCCLPYFCLFFYRTWRRRTKKTRTKFFYVWGLASLFYMYLLFEMVICTYSNISVWDNILMTLSVTLMCIALNFSKMDPGVVKSVKSNKQFSKTFGFFGNLLYANEGAEPEEDLEAGFEVIDKSELEEATNESMEHSKDQFMPSHHSDHVPWCDKCAMPKPARSGHCPVCAVCIRNRDHHCVWIDTCVGADNHRSFLVAMAMFVLIGYYGSYLTMMSVCDPASPHEVMCSFYHAYRDFKWGLCYAGAVYVAMVSSIMCYGLVHQIILISQNSTSQELHRATSLGRARCLLVAKGNPYNRGLVQNWIDFWKKKRECASYMDI